MNGGAAKAGKLISRIKTSKVVAAIEDGVVRMATGRLSPVRLLLGKATDAIGEVAARHGGVAAAQEAFSHSHWQLVASGDDAARIVFRGRARELRRALRTAAADSPDLGKQVTRAVGEVDAIVKRVRPRSGRLAAGKIRPNWWDRLFAIAESDPSTRAALVAFQDACATGHLESIEYAAAQLKTAVAKRVSMSKAKAFGDRLNGVVRRLSAVAAGGDGAKALLALDALVDKLDPADPVRIALARMRQAVQDNGDRWFEVGNLVAGMRRALTAEEERGLTWRLKGLLGEMLAMSTRAYRALYRESLAEAENLVKRLNATPPGGWSVTTRRGQIRAPAAGSSPRLAQFYDDAIIVYRAGDGTGPGQAIVVLATQVKSGDMSSGRVVEQILKDIRRENGQLIEFGGTPYTLTSVPELTPTRVFVATTMPTGPPAASGVAAQAIVMPMGGDDIEMVSRAMLEANELLVP